MTADKPIFTVLYNNRNITQDIAKYLLSLTYTDNTEGESDEVQIELEDVDALWQNGWYPEKGAKLTVTIKSLKCGVFQIDEIEFKGAPDTVSIKGMATGITGSLRTKKSDAHENKTLKQIAEKVASKNNLTVAGTVPDITIERSTQNKETDLAYLRRISKEYGIVFSVRDEVITFTSIYDLEKRGVSFTMDKTDLSSYNLKDKADAPKASKSVYADPKKNEKVEQDLAFAEFQEEEGYDAPATASGDMSVDYGKSENATQAKEKAKAVMHLSSTNQFEGTVEFEGNDLACAGNNFKLTGVGVLSGKYHIKSSTRSIDRSGGDKSSCEIKRLQLPTKSEQVTKKKRKTQPTNVNVLKTNTRGGGAAGETAFSNNIVRNF